MKAADAAIEPVDEMVGAADTMADRTARVVGETEVAESARFGSMNSADEMKSAGRVVHPSAKERRCSVISSSSQKVISPIFCCSAAEK